MSASRWLKRLSYPAVLSMTTLLLMTVYFNASSDSCTYVVNGTIKVESRFPEFEDEKIDLSAKDTPGLWWFLLALVIFTILLRF